MIEDGDERGEEDDDGQDADEEDEPECFLLGEGSEDESDTLVSAGNDGLDEIGEASMAIPTRMAMPRSETRADMCEGASTYQRRCAPAIESEHLSGSSAWP